MQIIPIPVRMIQLGDFPSIASISEVRSSMSFSFLSIIPIDLVGSLLMYNSILFD